MPVGIVFELAALATKNKGRIDDAHTSLEYIRQLWIYLIGIRLSPVRKGGTYHLFQH